MEKHVQAVRARLQEECRNWFNSDVDQQREGLIARQLHDHCFYNRAVNSPADAMFVARFIRLAHDFGTPGFSAALAYSHFFSTGLSTRIYTCTENEARNLGRCLYLMLVDLDAWYLSESKYNEEALGTADGSEATLPGMQYRTKNADTKKTMDYDSFKNFYAKLHNSLSTSLKACLISNTEFSPKNAIVIALQLLPFFPIMDTNARSIEDSVRKLVDGKLDNKIGPEQVPAFKSYLNQLKTRQTQRPCVSYADFHPNGAKQFAVNQKRALAVKQAEEKAAAEAAAAKAAEQKEQEAKAEPEKEQIDAAPVENPTPAQSDAKALREKLERTRSARAAAAESRIEDGAKTTAPDKEHGDDGRNSRDVKDIREQEKSTMPPPEKPEKPMDEKSIEDERKRSRARRFGGLVDQPPTSPMDRPGSRGSTPVPPRPQRSGTEDSRTSDRSRRREDDRERGDRGNERDRRRDGRDARDERDDRDDRRGERGHRRERGDRSERSDRSDRSDRGERSDRGDRGDRGERGERRSHEKRERRDERREEHDRPPRREEPREERREESSRRSRRNSPAREPRDGRDSLPAKPVTRSPRRNERREEPTRDPRDAPREHRDREPARNERETRARSERNEKPPTPRAERPPNTPRDETRPGDRQTPRQSERETPRQPEPARPSERDARPTPDRPDRPERETPRELRINSRARDTSNAGGSLAARMGLVAENGSTPGSPNRKRPFDEDGKDSPDPKRKRNEGGDARDRERREERREPRGGRRRKGEGGGRMLVGAMKAASSHNDTRH